MPKLFVENGPDRGRVFVIAEEGPFFGGRDAALQAPIRDEMASRRHFQIELRNRIYYLRDLDSANGVFVNGERVRGTAELTPNDRIQIGETILTFQGEEPHPLIGKEIAGYRILSKIGRGGMGTVYKALQISLDRIVALKVLAPHLLENTSFVNLFIREARAAGGLSHPNIVQVYDVGVHESIYFFSMEYIPNGSVEDILNREGILPLSQALRIVRDAALGLQYAESKGVIHRDIKPGNLMVGTGGIIKIGDLGIARSTGGEGSISQKDGVSGSPHYIAPEQARGQDIDHRVDIYSLGVSFYHMLCGKTPFSGSTPREVILKQIREAAPPLLERAPNVPPEVAELVGRMMAKDRDDRVASATTLLEELQPLTARYGSGEIPAAAAPAGFDFHRFLLFVLIAVVVGGAGFGTVWGVRKFQEARTRERQHLDQLRESLDDIAKALDDGKIDAAGQGIDSLRGEVLPSDLAVRLSGLAERHEGLRVALEKEQFEQRAAKRLVEIRPASGAAPTEDAVGVLRNFARDFPKTKAAAEANRLADEMESSLEARAAHEGEAKRALEPLQTKATALAQAGNYLRARNELLQFDSSYADTEAGKQWKQALNAVEQQAIGEWNRVLRSVQGATSKGQFIDAASLLDDFASRAEIPILKDRIEQERDLVQKQRQNANKEETDQKAQRESAFAKALRKSWKALAELDFRTARPPLADLGFETVLDDGTQKRVDAHLRFIDHFPSVLDSMAGKPPRERNVSISMTSGDTRKVELVRLQSQPQRIYYRSPGDPHGVDRYVAWSEVTPDCRARLLLLWARTPEELLYAGFFARINGAEEAGTDAWKKAISGDSKLRSARDDLQELFELTHRSG